MDSSQANAATGTVRAEGYGYGYGEGEGEGHQLARERGDVLDKVLGDVLHDLRGAGGVRAGEDASCAPARACALGRWLPARLLRLVVQREVRVGLLGELLRRSSTGAR